MKLNGKTIDLKQLGKDFQSASFAEQLSCANAIFQQIVLPVFLSLENNDSKSQKDLNSKRKRGLCEEKKQAQNPVVELKDLRLRPIKADSSDVYLEYLLRGNLKKGFIRLGDVVTELAGLTFDIGFNEIEHSIYRINKSPSLCEIVKLAPRLRWMNWMMLAHVGKCVGNREVAQDFGFGDVKNPRERANRIWQYHQRLAKWLPDNLHKRVFTSGVQTYRINTEGWSFWWLRRNENALESELIYDLPSKFPQEKAY